MSEETHGVMSHAQELQIATEMSDLDRAFFNLKGHLQEQGVEQTAIDQLTVLDYEVSGGRKGPRREHLLLAVDSLEDDFRDIIWYSPAPESQSEQPFTCITKPGLGEIIESGIGKDMHIQLANRNPHANFITHATQGFGPEASIIPLGEIASHSLDVMSERALRLIHTYCPGHKLMFIATSMGTVGTHKLLNHDREHTVSDTQLDVAGVIYYANALVDPSNIPRDMLGRFLPSTALDCLLEITLRSSPRHFLHKLRTVIESKPRGRDVALIGRLVVDLLQGIDEEAIALNAAEHPTYTISGIKDPLAQPLMWDRTNAKQLPVPGGHGIVLDTRGGATKITKTIAEETEYGYTPSTSMEVAA